MTMERAPHMPPQTSMERHIELLVNDLRNGTATRGEFYQKVESAMAHAFWLEKHCSDMIAENERLRKYIAVQPPPIVARMSETSPTALQTLWTFDWLMERVCWRALLAENNFADRSFMRRMRKETYRGLLRAVRKAFEATFDVNEKRLADLVRTNQRVAKHKSAP